MLFDLQLYVLDTWVKREAELSTDHQLVVSWIIWCGHCWTNLVNPNM